MNIQKSNYNNNTNSDWEMDYIIILNKDAKRIISEDPTITQINVTWFPADNSL